MTQADRVFSTPPTNTSVTRRKILGTAAVAAAALAATGAVAAAIPTAAAEAGIAPDPAFVLIAEKLAADIAHCEAIDAQDEAETCPGIGSDAAEEAFQRCCVACGVVNEADWRLATTPPTTLAGVAAVLRFANQIEDGGMEWPDTDAVS